MDWSLEYLKFLPGKYSWWQKLSTCSQVKYRDSVLSWDVCLWHATRLFVILIGTRRDVGETWWVFVTWQPLRQLLLTLERKVWCCTVFRTRHTDHTDNWGKFTYSIFEIMEGNIMLRAKLLGCDSNPIVKNHVYKPMRQKLEYNKTKDSASTNIDWQPWIEFQWSLHYAQSRKRSFALHQPYSMKNDVAM